MEKRTGYKMANNSQWQWKTGKPPGPQSVRVGSLWKFHLPLAGTDDAPKCEWSSNLFEQCIPQVNDNSLELVLPLLHGVSPGIYQVNFTFASQPNLDGHLLLKVLPEERPVPHQTEEPHRAKKPLTTESEKGSCDSSARTDTISSAPASGTPDVHDGTPNGVLKQPPSPSNVVWPIGGYTITVRRGDISIPQLKQMVEKHKSLLVGKFSVSRGICPDIDLRPHFESREAAKKCSRNLAKIYCINEQVMLENLGKYALTVSGSSIVKTGESHAWKRGECVTIPGGINLTLNAETLD